LKYFLTLLFIIFSLQTIAGTIKLNYEPEGLIIKFIFDSCIAYTDTTALFANFNHIDDGRLPLLNPLKNLVKSRISKSQNDTVTFNGSLITYYDSLPYQKQAKWNAELTVIHLAKNNKVKLFNNRGHLIETIAVQKRKSKRKRPYSKKSMYYFDKKTNGLLFIDTPYRVMRMREIIDP
jgi:hypothetical protein